MDTEFFIPALWFFSGAVCYRFVANIVNFSHAAYFVQETNKNILLLIGFLSEDIEMIRKKKYELMKEAGASKSEVSFIKGIDRETLNAWKVGVITRFFTVYPKGLHKLIPFTTWQEAMEELSKTHKKSI
tara:strand:+ start:204 stop:590 length:387 start_codon:yes stop_codon:yes gene_type:complete